ncbi:centlein [Spea bombifrons]|uniref:centlein n=1 Tax=Spea bombifrons TaxID=233779 RepID=UPI00234B48C9|nr:centlein [Spea bombifrons]
MALKQKDQERILQLEDEVAALSEELSQCQADKEFVWSLWKRLQVANPDLTQAISLVVDREKNKAEAKDRKVLEILQVKDRKIHELEQRTSGQQQEINNLVQRKIAVDEENTLLKKELNDLQEILKDKSQELKSFKENAKKNEEQGEVILRNIEREKEDLSKRFDELLNDLDRTRKQEVQWRGEKSAVDAKIKDLEVNLQGARWQMEDMHNKINSLSSQVAIKQTELTQREVESTRLRKELQELQNLYKQSNEHAAQQAELIQQLQALNVDTQKVLRSQEDAHTSETISYQKLYNDLNACYDALKSNETQLRQNNIALKEQLHQKEEQISQLQGKLREALSTLPRPPQEPQDVAHPSLAELELIIASQKSEIKFLQDRLKTADLQLIQVDNCRSDALENSILRAGRKVQPGKRSRSLSPKAISRESEELKKLKIAEKRIEHLEQTLRIKDQENEELRKAHEKRRERLLALQSSYRAAKQQIEQCDRGCARDKDRYRKAQRADPSQLRHEDSDAVWNELAYYRREHKKLQFEIINLEEELDQLKVQASSDKATIQELSTCLKQEREELLFRLNRDEGVRNSTPKKNTDETLQRTLKKVCYLDRKLAELEIESRKLEVANEELTKEKNSLKASCRHLRKDAEARDKKTEELIAKNLESNQVREALEVKNDELNREVASLKRQLAGSRKLRNEKRDLLKQVQSLKCALEQAEAANSLTSRQRNSKQGINKEAGTKVKHRAAKKISLRRHQAFLNQSIKAMSTVFENFSKDGWEDVSEDSDSEPETSESLEHVNVTSTETAQSSSDECNTVDESTGDDFTDKGWRKTVPREIHHVKANLKGAKKICTKKCHLVSTYHPSSVKVRRDGRSHVVPFKPSLASLRQRVVSLQHQVSVLQKGKQAATAAVKQFKEEKIKLAAELHLAHQRLQISKQMAKKLSTDLTEFQREKESLERTAEQMKEQLALAKRSLELLSPVTSDQSPDTPLTPSKSTEIEMKQLQNKLKNMTMEMAKQSSTMKSMKNEVQEKEERIRELQERVVRMERDVNMKRHLIEDLKTRLKTHQENEKPGKEMLESLERKVKALTDECSQKKVSTDSLKQRLAIATKEKARYEQMYHKATDDLEKKNVKIGGLEVKVRELERSFSEMESAATQQLHSLAGQSKQSMEAVQSKLLLVNRRADELTTFVKNLAKELQLNTCDIRTKIRQAKMLQESAAGPSKESVHRAQLVAASILNISTADLDEILDVQSEEELANMRRLVECDKEWMNHVLKLLEGQPPFAPCLMEAILRKLNEKRKLLEDYTLLKKDTR